MKLKREVDRRGQMLDIIKQMDDLTKTEKKIGTIGVHLSQVSLDAPVYISSLVPKGAGAKAGLNAGDILMAIDGLPITDHNDATLRILKFASGTTHMIAVRRGARELAFPVMAEVMGESDINELKAQTEDRYRIALRLYSEATRSTADRTAPQLKN